uniref:Uncharacterized protein n=1 Tax=Pararge aegeria TaxID=116150 RepID=S4P999_9NEOP
MSYVLACATSLSHCTHRLDCITEVRHSFFDIHIQNLTFLLTKNVKLETASLHTISFYTKHFCRRHH